MAVAASALAGAGFHRAQCDPDYSVGSAFGLLIAPLAGLARYFPTLGELGVSGTGVAPALIALTLYALLPLVRGVVTGLQQVPQDAPGKRDGNGHERRATLSSGAASAGDVGTAAQPAGGQRANRRHGGSGRADRRRRLWRAGFQGLLSSALDLVLLGVVPTIALAVVVDALFALWGARLKRRAND